MKPAKPPKPPKPTAIDTSLPVPGVLGAVLAASGVRAVITLTDDDGAPLEPAALDVARVMFAAWAEREKRVDALITAAAALLPAGAVPSGTLVAAVAASNGARAARDHAAARAPKRPAKGARR